MVRSLGMAQTLLRPEQVDDLVAQYREGATLVELASRFGVNRRTVAMHLTRREVTIRAGGSILPASTKQPTSTSAG